ncbi:MAG: leucyl aminopeptidase family protein [Alphaproteobacteria bacterium]|nr:leucyl aminopeptidase family protein [Alphaproteobacteria bacterium]
MTSSATLPIKDFVPADYWQWGDPSAGTITCWLVARPAADSFLASVTPAQKKLLQLANFPESSLYYLPNGANKEDIIYIYQQDAEESHWSPLAFSALPALLTQTNQLSCQVRFFQPTAITRASCYNFFQGLAIGYYDFLPFKKDNKIKPKLFFVHDDKPFHHITNDDWQELLILATAIHRGRDLINLPANYLGPAELAEQVATIGKRHDATVRHWVGEELLAANFPLIYHVGKGSSRAPRLVELRWWQEHHPLLCLVGKGVCFDSGGLNLKNGNGMWLMKKDMGGASIALNLADAIMANHLPYRLMLLLPMAENMPDGQSYRPSDILTARNGLRIEVGDTDAEGRLLLADALAYGCEHQPEMMIDFSTLTGAARVAVGTDMSAFFCNDASISQQLIASGNDRHDHLWPLPLYKPYRSLLNSNHADISSTGHSHYAGAITAALFLQQFIGDVHPWVHIDTMAWQVSGAPGQVVGGVPMSLLACYDF